MNLAKLSNRQPERRALTLFERAMYMDGGQPVNVALAARLHGELDEVRLSVALTRLQELHPVLRCLIAMEQGRPHFIEQASPPQIPLSVVRRRGEYYWIEIVQRESLRPFDGQNESLCRLVWLRGDMDNEFVLVCHHAICDGRSLLNLLEQILRLHAEPLRELGVPRMLAPFESLFPAEVVADRSLRQRIRRRAGWMKAALRLLPISRRRWRYGQVYQHFWQMEAWLSQALLSRCKAEGVGPAVTFAAAFMLAFASDPQGPAIDKFVLPVDVRRFLPRIDPQGLFAIAPTVSLKALRKNVAGGEMTAAFWSLARALKGDLDVQIQHLGRKVYADFLGMELLHDVYHRMLAYGQSKRAGRQVSLSYMGQVKIAPWHGSVELRNVLGVSAVLAPTPANLIVVSSYAGYFHFSLSSDEISLPYAVALRIIERAMAILQASVREVRSTSSDEQVPLPATVESL